MQVIAQSAPAVRRDRFISLGECERITSLKKSSLYRLMRERSFPQCVRLTPRRVAWVESQVLSWVQARAPREAQS